MSTNKPQAVMHDTAAAVAFLARWHGDEQVICTSIIPDGKTTTRTFRSAADPALSAWIEERQKVENLYFSVNPMRRALTSKSSKEDTARLGCLHVDVDQRAGEDYNEERARILKMMLAADPPFSALVDSGGGYQGFYKLVPEKQLEINGDVTRAQELEAYNLSLERKFAGDHCHNVDRIMRIPHSWNMPSARKIKKGRFPVVAQLVHFNDAVYPLSTFTRAVRVQPKNAGLTTSGAPVVNVTGNLPEIGTEELQTWAVENGKNISEHLLALIATGDDPNNPGKYPSRSEAVFAVTCGLVRAGVPEEMIMAVLLGPNEIGASIREARRPTDYAARQVARALENAIDPALRELNDVHAVIGDMGGRCRIISEVPDEIMKRTRISKSTFEDFRNRYNNKSVSVGRDGKGNEVYKPLGTWWLSHPQRRQYDTVVFAPNRIVRNAYNLWTGFSCESSEGNKHEILLDHILKNVCAGDLEHYTYLISWLARLVQEPGSPGQVAVVMRGKRGTGKGFLVKQVGALFGRHYLQVSDSKHLTGTFNAHLRDVVLLFGDEAFFAGDKRHEATLKTLITEDTMVVEGKGIDAESAMNYVHLFLASNADWVVPAGLDERRFFVLEVGDDQRQNTKYFKDMQAVMDDGGLENLLHFLLSYDLSEFEVRKVPQTKALQDQKILSMGVDLQWFYERLRDGRMLPAHQSWTPKVVREALYMEYIRDSQLSRKGYGSHTLTSFTKFIAQCCPKGQLISKQETCDVPVIIPETGVQTTKRMRAQVYYFPALDVLREFWDRSEMGGPYDWPKWEGSQEELEADEVRRERAPF